MVQTLSRDVHVEMKTIMQQNFMAGIAKYRIWIYVIQTRRKEFYIQFDHTDVVGNLMLVSFMGGSMNESILFFRQGYRHIVVKI